MIIITGASRGIGKFLFDTLIKEKEEVIGTYNSFFPEEYKNIEYFYKVDISDYYQVQKWIENVKPKLSRIVLINNAGITYNKFAHKSDINKWKEVINVNLIGTFNVIHLLLPIMREQRFGRIINFSSVVTKLPTQGVSAYAASKAGLIGLTKTLAVENGAFGITANTINLGYVKLGMGINEVSEVYSEKILQGIPLGRFCNPEEVMKTIKYLINTEYMNGSNIDINGGII